MTDRHTEPMTVGSIDLGDKADLEARIAALSDGHQQLMLTLAAIMELLTTLLKIASEEGESDPENELKH